MTVNAEAGKRSILEKLTSVDGGAGIIVGLIGLSILADAKTLAVAGLGLGFMAFGFLLIKHQSLTKDADKYFRK